MVDLDLNSTIKILGRETTGMVAVEPSSNDREIVCLFKKLDEILQKPSTHMFLDDVVSRENEEESGVRKIQAGRYEVFLDASPKSSRTFDVIARQMGQPNLKYILRKYAIRQARKDPRLRPVDSDYNFQNFSLIISYESVPFQAPHIDVVDPNYQFVITVTDYTDGTLLYESPNCLHNLEHLVCLWNEKYGFMPNSIVQAFKSEPRIRGLIRDYGRVLLLDNQPLQRKRLRSGTLLSLPGSVVHGGPTSRDFRAVLFFSANPVNNGVAAYHPDTQYTSVFLCGELISLIWNKPDISSKDRLFLLHVLASYVDENSVKTWNHFVVEGLSHFVHAIETKDYHPYLSRKKYIKSQARNLSLCDRSVVLDDNNIIKSLVKVSVPGLMTTYQAKSYCVEVYQKQGDNSDGRVVLRYPGLVKDGSVTYEGLDKNDNYTLTMASAATSLFDGSNGSLTASDGTAIPCYKEHSVPTRVYSEKGDHCATIYYDNREIVRRKDLVCCSETNMVPLLVCVSVRGLMTDIDGISYLVEVYKQKKQQQGVIKSSYSDVVLLYYPGEKSWEGLSRSERYKLEMKSTTELFNGSNGVLVDTVGNQISCYSTTWQQKRPALNIKTKPKKKRLRPYVIPQG